MPTDEPGSEFRAQSQYKKHFRACEFCRQRKVGCDAADSPGNRCTMCTAHGMECKYNPGPPPKKTRKRPSGRYVEALETRLSKVEGLVKKLQSDAALKAGDDAPNLHDTPRPPRLPNRSSIKAIYPRGVHPTTDSSEDIDPSDTEQVFAVTDVNFKGYMGKSSNFDLVRTVLDLKREHDAAFTYVEYEPLRAELQNRFAPDMITVDAMFSSIVPPFKYEDFPPPDVMAELVDLYFEHCNTYLPLLHRPTFESELKSTLHARDRGFGAVVLLVCATGSAWAYRSLHPEPHQSPGRTWFNKVTTTQYPLFARPRLYDVQACALMAAYMNTTNSPQGTLPVLSLGIRMAQDVGAHRKKMYGATPTVEQELWRRAFWALVAMDRLASFGIGRQCITHDEDFDIDPMIECDDEYWLHADPLQTFQQPRGKPSTVAFCNAFVRLLKIQAFASRTIFTTNKSKLLSGYVGPEWKQRIVAEIDSSLNKWLDTIPSHLRWDPSREDAVFFNQSAILYTNYYQLQIFVHRCFIPSSRRPLASANPSLPSLTVCTSAAGSCLRVLDAQYRRLMPTRTGFSLYALTPMQMPLFTVGIMLLISLWAGTRDTRATLKDVELCLSMMKELSDAGVLAARKLRIVLSAMCPTPQPQPDEGSQPPSSSNLAKEGPKTIDDLVVAGMQQITISGLRVADGSDARADPTNGEILSLLTVPKVEPEEPSPFVTTTSPNPNPNPGSSSARGPAQTTPGEQAANHSWQAFGAFAHPDLWARQPSAFDGDFKPPGPRPRSASGTVYPGLGFTDAPGETESASSLSLGLGLGLGLGAVSTPPSNLDSAGPSELDFTFGDALMADDLAFFDSLSDMFGNGPGSNSGSNLNLNPPASPSSSPRSAGGPLPLPTTTVDPAATWSPSQPEVPYAGAPVAANPMSGEVQREGSKDPKSWMWIRDQWEAFCHRQEAPDNSTQPPL